MGFRRTPDQSSRGGNYVEPGWPQNAAPYYRRPCLLPSRPVRGSFSAASALGHTY
jgi:hypothetical protein